MLSGEKVAEVSSLTVLSIICVCSNMLVCYVVQTRKTTQAMAKYYIFSLAITDIMVGTISIPLAIWNLVEGIDHENSRIYGKMYPFMNIVSVGSSILHLCIMSIDRAVAIAKPLYYRGVMTKSKVFKLLTTPWLIAVSFAALYIGIPKSCVPKFNITFVLLFYAVPILVIAASYTCIFVKIRQRNASKHTVGGAGLINEGKLARMIFCVIIVFVICWTPFQTVSIYMVVKKPTSASLQDIPWSLVLWMEYLNSACNPFIYAIFHPQFKQAFRDVFRRLLCCKTRAVLENDIDDGQIYLSAKDAKISEQCV